MNYLILSDIHGSVDPLLNLDSIIDRFSINKIILLGDILYFGPRNIFPNNYNPKKVIEILNNYKEMIISIRGNCDSEVDQMVLDFPITADYNLIPLTENSTIFATHGHLYTLENLSFLTKHDIYLSGHTHIPQAEIIDGLYVLNPGSCSLPKNNSEKSFAILTKNNFTIYNFNYEIVKSILIK